MCRALQKQFAEQEKATGGTHLLSMDALTAAMTKRKAARIFYQICGAPLLPCALFGVSSAVVAQLTGHRCCGRADICHDQGRGYQDLYQICSTPACEALLKLLLPDKCYAGTSFSASGIHFKIIKVLQAGGLQTGSSWS